MELLKRMLKVESLPLEGEADALNVNLTIKQTAVQTDVALTLKRTCTKLCCGVVH